MDKQLMTWLMVLVLPVLLVSRRVMAAPIELERAILAAARETAQEMRAEGRVAEAAALTEKLNRFKMPLRHAHPTRLSQDRIVLNRALAKAQVEEREAQLLGVMHAVETERDRRIVEQAVQAGEVLLYDSSGRLIRRGADMAREQAESKARALFEEVLREHPDALPSEEKLRAGFRQTLAKAPPGKYSFDVVTGKLKYTFHDTPRGEVTAEVEVYKLIHYMIAAAAAYGGAMAFHQVRQWLVSRHDSGQGQSKRSAAPAGSSKPAAQLHGP